MKIHLSRKRRRKQQRQAIGKNWRDVMEYERFIASMVKLCRCQSEHQCPCDGVLAGGPCDERYDELDWPDSDEEDDS